ncbi:MAG: hypothetical protein MUF06_21085, partial [Pirellulaceae bacterium]|nr:hypothetical protein [Pirellulaceae bacterium]
MSYAPGRKYRPQRGSSVGLPPNFFAKWWDTLRQRDILLRVGLFLAVAVLLWVITGGGIPQFAYRTGDVPARKIVTRVDFQLENTAETDNRRAEARRLAEVVYVNDIRPLDERRQELIDKVGKIVEVESFAVLEADEGLLAIWREFSPTDPERPAGEDKRRFDALKSFFKAGMQDNRYDEAVRKAIEPLHKLGLLREHKPAIGSQASVLVRDKDSTRGFMQAKIEEIRIDKQLGPLKTRLDAEFKGPAMSADEHAGTVLDLTWTWLESRLPETLTLDKEATAKVAE